MKIYKHEVSVLIERQAEVFRRMCDEEQVRYVTSYERVSYGADFVESCREMLTRMGELVDLLEKSEREPE